MSEVGRWMEIYPENFLEDGYLKYIGWSLHDKEADVRRRCLEVLSPLYENQQLVDKLELFTNRFKVCTFCARAINACVRIESPSVYGA
jgi:cohesin complex subunit SA-1/2